MSAKDTLFAKSKAELAELAVFYSQIALAYSSPADISILGIAYLQYANFVKSLRDNGKAPKDSILTNVDFQIMLEDLRTLEARKGEEYGKSKTV